MNIGRYSTKICVIVPAFQAEKTIERCINSVMDQSFEDWELIVVDDGSSDDTFELAHMIAGDDPRITILKQSNRGRCAARNLGVENARSPWVSFLDSDDYLAKEALASLYERATTDVSGVWGGYCSPNGKSMFTCACESIDPSKAYKSIQFPSLLLKETSKEDGTLYRAVWGKLYSLSTIRDSQLVFHDGLRFGEDALFNLEYLDHSNKRIAIVNNPVYYYDTSKSSTVGCFDISDGEHLEHFARLARNLHREKERSGDPGRYDLRELVGFEAALTLRRAAESGMATKEIAACMASSLTNQEVVDCLGCAAVGGIGRRMIGSVRYWLLKRNLVACAIELEKLVIKVKRFASFTFSGRTNQR